MRIYAFLICSLAFYISNAQTEKVDKIDAILSDYNSSNEPGFSVKVIDDGEAIYSKGFGLSNLDYDIKNSDSTVFSLASITKQFTASAIWALIKENKINLNDDIRLYLPEFPKYDEVIQIKHLLNHTSGIRNYHTLMHLSGFDYNKFYYDNATVLELACKQKGLNALPNEKVLYSNTNYNLLAIIVERITNMDLDAYLKLQILKPLQMHQTYNRIRHGKVIKNKAIGYQKSKDSFTYNLTNQLSYGAGSMGSTINDMTKWINMLNGNNLEFLELATFLQTTEVLKSGQNATYARGIMLDNYKGKTVLGHSGFGFGGRTHIIAVPEKDIGVIILTNLQSINATTIAYDILDVLLPETGDLKNETLENSTFKVQSKTKFIGDYKEINSDMKMSIFIEKDTLKAFGSFGKTAIPLKQYDTDKFHRLNSQNVKYDFSKSETHDMIISFGGTPFYFKRAKFIEEDIINVSEYIGDFYAEELDVVYSFSVENNRLQLSYKGNKDIGLNPIQLNEFGNNDRTLYHFVKDESNTVTGMLLSCDGTVKNVIFNKRNVTN